MNDELQKIKDAQKRRFELLTDLTNLKEKLAKQKKRQQEAIYQGRDSLWYETAIIRVETKIAGTKSVIKSLDEDIKGLDEEQAKQEREKKKLEIEHSKKECFDTATEIYLLFSNVVEKYNLLKEKYSRYRSLSRGMLETPQEVQFKRKISNLSYLVKSDVSELLRIFPKEVYADEEIPNADALIKSLNK